MTAMLNSPASLLPDSQQKLKQFFQLGLQHSCPREQLVNFPHAGLILQERQLAASTAVCRVTRPAEYGSIIL